MRVAGFFLGTLLSMSVAAFATQTLSPTNYGEMEPVLFNHTDHADQVGCDGCHHNSNAEHRCGYCHQAEEREGVLSMEDAAHGDNVGKCWGCHLKEKVKRALECEDCHSG